MNPGTVQFPLCGLACGDNPKNRVLACIAWGIVTAGRMQIARLPSDEADEKCKHTGIDAPKSFSREHLRILQLGQAFIGVGFAHATYPWQAAERVEAFLCDWKSKGRTAPMTRVPSDIAKEVGWHHGDYKVFSALCALNAAIGSKPYAIVTRSRIRAGMLGYSSGRMLFDEEGQLTDGGKSLLAEREDGITSVLSGDQVRTLLAKLVTRKLAQRFTPYRGSLTYYSKFLPPELIGEALVKRAERKTCNPKLTALGARLKALKAGVPLSGDSPLSGDTAPHNETAPHNGEVPTQAPPEPHPVPTQAPHNASVLMPLGNASSNASKEMLGASLCVKDSKPEIPEAKTEEKTEPPAPVIPNYTDAMEFASSLKKSATDAEVSAWFESFVEDPDGDWKRSLARTLIGKKRKASR